MNQGVSLLDEALSLARQEMAALADGAFDRAVELAERRQEVISMAWPVLADDREGLCRDQVMQLADIQDRLSGVAVAVRESLRADLQRSRLERQRMHGYHMSVGQALQ